MDNNAELLCDKGTYKTILSYGLVLDYVDQLNGECDSTLKMVRLVRESNKHSVRHPQHHTGNNKSRHLCFYF